MQDELNQEPIYQGQFGVFTITAADRREVILYRAGMITMALCCGSGALLAWNSPQLLLSWFTPLLALFSLALGLSLWTVHIYLGFLHRFLQLCWGIGTLSALVFFLNRGDQPLALILYSHPLTLLGVGFIFVSLTGLFFKEAFCFNRLETKILTLLVPGLLLGHLFQILPPAWELRLLLGWGLLFSVFALRKSLQPIPPDIGDKSVFTYLRNPQAFSADPHLNEAA
ncbi:MAG: DUF2301 domain-containing membrane protein [Synechococcaceae cyanobacterium SM2_3_1]|nr:DUF2301 domain-containing membrane protein [Synechococcaceae cyanobacterium SM2_3_1]